MISAYELSARRNLSHSHFFQFLFCSMIQDRCAALLLWSHFFFMSTAFVFCCCHKSWNTAFSHSMNATSQLGVLSLHLYTVTQIWNTHSNFDQYLSLSFSLCLSFHIVHHQLWLWVLPLLDGVCKQAEFQMRFHPEKLNHFLLRDMSSVYHVWLHLRGWWDCVNC